MTQSRNLTWRVGASLSDFEATREIARELHLAGHFGHVPFSEKKRDDLAEVGLREPDLFATILCEQVPHDGTSPKVVGLSMLGIEDYLLAEDLTLCTIYAFGVSASLSPMLRGKAALGLWKASRAWSRMKGASEMMVAVTNGLDIDSTFWRRAGASFVGNNFSIKLTAS